MNQSGSAIGGGISASTTSATPGMNNSMNSGVSHHPSHTSSSATSSLTAGPAFITHAVTLPSSSSSFDPTNYFNNNLFHNNATPIVEVIWLPPATGRFVRSFCLCIVPVPHPTNISNTKNTHTSLVHSLSDSTSAGNKTPYPSNSLLYVC